MNRRIALIAVATMLALIGTFAVYNYAHGADKRAIAGSQTTQVLVAKKRVPAGTTWGAAAADGLLSQENVPANSAPQTALASLESPVSSTDVASADIAPGQIVVREMFGTETADTGVLSIPKGLMALTVSLPSNADVAGYVAPKSEVAIFAIFGLTLPKDAPASTQNTVGTSLEGVKLLESPIAVLATSQAAPTAVSPSSSSATSSSSAGGTLLVTLAVTQDQAEHILLAQQTGQLYLGLLSATSVTAPDAGVVNIANIAPTPIFVK